jgi:hypothetical protein
MLSPVTQRRPSGVHVRQLTAQRVRFWQVCTYLLVMLDTGQPRYADGGSSCTQALSQTHVQALLGEAMSREAIEGKLPDCCLQERQPDVALAAWVS